MVRKLLKMERETGLEPATSSLGIVESFESIELRRLRPRTACTQNQGFPALPELCSKKCSKRQSPLTLHTSHTQVTSHKNDRAASRSRDGSLRLPVI